MRNSRILIILFLLISLSSVSAQAPTYALSPIYQISLPTDTIRSYQLFDLNGDSISDVIYSTLDEIRAFNSIDGTSLLDSVSFPRGFVFCPYRNHIDSAVDIYTARLERFFPNYSFKIIKFPLLLPTERDSFSVNSNGDQYSIYYSGLTKIGIFDVYNDGNNELMLFWNFHYSPAGSNYYDSGYYIAFDLSGNLIINTTVFGSTLKGSSFVFNDSLYYSALTQVASYTSPGYANVYVSLNLYNDSLRLIDANSLAPANPDYKVLGDQNNPFQALLSKESSLIRKFDNPYLDNPISHGMAGTAIISFFRFQNAQKILTGLQNNYYEMRDINMNLQAFVWGPNITISDADAVDIDRDGTDELLCRTATGFVLCRLDTTSTAIYEGANQLPENLSILAYPNPFNSEVKLSLSGPRDIPVSIGIYDITGRLVRSLLSVNGQAIWDGISDQGEVASSGVYLIRASSGTKSAIEKVVLLR